MSPHPHSPDNDPFDDAVRKLHAQALDSTSARTQAQLQQRRRAALAGMPAMSTRRFAWPLLATGAAAVMALAIGLQLRGGDVPNAAQPDDAQVAASPMNAADDNVDALAMLDDGIDSDLLNNPVLDENPDLYLWLVSDDAAEIVTE